MMAGEGVERRTAPRRTWMRWLAAALVLVLMAVGYVQWRQHKLLDSASFFQNDAMG